MSGRSGRRRRRVSLDARAKINLGLAVGPRRSDGFHELATIFQSVSLADTLAVTPMARGFALRVRFEDASLPRSGAARRSAAARRWAGHVPLGAKNLVLRAARLLAARFSLPGGARFTLVKRIPAGAGLGGASADAAAALVGLAALYRLPLSGAEAMAMGAALGADVPFALMGGTALGLGRGERLRRLRLERRFRALLAVPAWRVPTAQAFRALARHKYGLTRWARNLRFVEAVGRQVVRPLRALRLGNAFESALGERRAQFASLCGRLRRAGAEAPHLTGSGSAVFGILPDALAVEQVVERFSGSEMIYLLRSRGRGLTRSEQP